MAILRQFSIIVGWLHSFVSEAQSKLFCLVERIHKYRLSLLKFYQSLMTNNFCPWQIICNIFWHFWWCSRHKGNSKTALTLCPNKILECNKTCWKPCWKYIDCIAVITILVFECYKLIHLGSTWLWFSKIRISVSWLFLPRQHFDHRKEFADFLSKTMNCWTRGLSLDSWWDPASITNYNAPLWLWTH